MPSRTICDTMIWYYLRNGKLNINDYKDDNLTTTFINIHEVATSFNLLKITTDVRAAIQCMMVDSKVTLFDPPLIYLARLANPQINYESEQENHELFEATKRIANGNEIEETKKEQFKDWLEEREKPLNDFAQFTNENLDIIRDKITDKKKHALEDATQGNRAFVSMLVNKATNGKYNLENLDWSQVELFDRTLGSFFKELELSGNMKFQPNDLFDLLNLVYTQPGDKYFTMEKRWLRRINNAGMQKYLR